MAQIPNTKQDILSFLSKNVIAPNVFKIHYLNKFSLDKTWANAIEYRNATPEQITQANLRTITSNEIILDFEDKIVLDNTISKLKENELSFVVWETGSRGFHVQLFFDELLQYDLDTRDAIRKQLITQYQADLTKSSERSLLALEYSPHFKTGNLKQIITEHASPNHKLPVSKSDIANIISLIENFAAMTSSQQKEDFATYTETDPFFQYLKTHVIPDGQNRDSVVLKNIAIGLVWQGLSNEAIREKAGICTANLPGKNMSELIGWVQKVRTGQLTTYNYKEIDNWAKIYNHNDNKPFYTTEHYKTLSVAETVGTENVYDMMTLKQCFDLYMDNMCAKMQEIKDILFYLLLGVILDERDEDFRIHTIFTAYTSSGKDTVVNALLDIVNVYNEMVDDSYKVQWGKPIQLTDRALVGSVNQAARMHNIKNQDKDDFIAQEETETGELARKHLLAFTEGEIIFKPNKFSEQVQTILRRAMDKERHVEKMVNNVVVEFNTNSTILIASYPLDKTVNYLLENGLFQRAIYVSIEMTDELHEAIMEFTIKSLFDFGKKQKMQNVLVAIAKKLIAIKQWYNVNRDNFLLNSSNYAMHYKITDKLMKQVLDERKGYQYIGTESKLKIDAFWRRLQTFVMKIAILNSAANQRIVLEQQDVVVGFNIVKSAIQTICSLVWREDKRIGYLMAKEDKYTEAVKSWLTEQGRSVTSSEFITFCRDKLNISHTDKQVSLKKRLIQENVISERIEGKFRYISLISENLEEL